MAKTPKHFLLIPCGGSGPRLWPLSRASNPKQFLKIFSHFSILQETFFRSLKISSKNNIFVISNQKYLPEIKKQLKSYANENNIIFEPLKRNSLMAILYAVSIIESAHHDSIITVIPADHRIKNLASFKKDILLSAKLADLHNKIVAIGIKPTSPNPSYGYIVPGKHHQQFHVVNKFIEKPPSLQAEKLIKSNSFWNSGIYTFKISTLISEIAKLNKTYFNLYQKLIGKPNQKLLGKIYSLSPNLSFDVVISEKSKNLIMIPAGFDWNDIGDWRAIYQELPKDKNGHAAISKSTKFLDVNSDHCLVSGFNNKLIGLVGVNHLAVIDTPDALLVCNISDFDSFSVRDLIKKIVENKSTEKYFLKHGKK